MNFHDKLCILLDCLSLNIAVIADVDPVQVEEVQYQWFEEEVKRILLRHLTQQELEEYFELITNSLFVKVATIGYNLSDEITVLAKTILTEPKSVH